MNLEEEIRDGYKISSKMKHIWAVQLDMVSKLLDVCKKHNLSIWASSGTLLGAVRHKGFIPWDDDIDMVMMRDDYNKLISIAPSEFKAPYFFQCAYTESVPYHRGHAQLRMDGTTAILPTDYKLDFHHGIFIDIFVYDAVPETEKEISSLSEDITYWKRNVMQWVTFYHFSLNPIYNLRMLKRFIYLHTHKFIECYKKYEKTLSRYNISENEYVIDLGFRYEKKYIMEKKLNKNLFNKTIYLPFEDIELPVPYEYDKILSNFYGNYMIPVKQSTYHGGFLSLDPNRSYESYLVELRKKLK